ncbi:putative membrane fusion protein [Clostridium sp. CAG:590]|nr:putative membrane fusion protein [Clostridium sp. CAG:590]
MSGYHSRKPSNEFRMNIGTIIFAIIFFYIIIRILISLQKESLSIYEVQNSYIDTNISATALIVRQEELVNATSSGYVSYYVRDGEKIGKNKTVYTIDETGSIYEKIKDADSDAFELTNEGLSEIRTRISNFENYFNYASFSDVYNFHYDIENAVLELTNEAMIEQLTSLDDSSTDISTYKKVTTTDSGIITYYKDGYENFDIHNFKASDINKSNYKKATLKTGEIINSGDPVYKLITSENWYLIAELSDKQVKELSDQDTVTVNIHNSSKNITCNFELTKQDNKNFIIISLNQQMVNYINDRFIDIVIIQDQNNGLKIPNTSITKKSVYKIPIDYLSQGSDSTSNNLLNIKVLDDKGEVTLKQVSPDIYKTDDEYCYVDPNDFGQNDVLVNTQNNDTLALNTAEKAELQGVFCVNQGIATFRYIDVLYQDDEYTIVKPEVPYSIAWYDRIILDQSLVKENQIIK